MAYQSRFTKTTGSKIEWDDLKSLYGRVRAQNVRFGLKDPGKAASSSQGTYILAASPNWMIDRLNFVLNNVNFLKFFSGIPNSGITYSSGEKAYPAAMQAVDSLCFTLEQFCGYTSCSSFSTACNGYSPFSNFTYNYFQYVFGKFTTCNVMTSGGSCISGFSSTCFSFSGYKTCANSGYYGSSAFFSCFSNSFSSNYGGSHFSTFCSSHTPNQAGFNSAFNAGSFIFTFVS